jgi:hypothetical protein
MTLIACLHPRQCRTLFADVLISSKESSNEDFALPTRAYIAPDWFNSLSVTPCTYRRKVIEVTPQLVILWSGDYPTARQLATRARDWFTMSSPSEDDVLGLLYAHYREPIPKFQAIIVPASGDRLYTIEAVQRNQSSGCGEYIVGGTGSEIFTEMVHQMLPSDGVIPPELEALRIANDFMAQEMITGAPVRTLFSGAYEILYHATNEGFNRVDDVMHIFRFVRVLSDDKIEIYQGPHVTRQWYDGSQLCVVSLSSPVAVEQQLESIGFPVASILEEPKQFTRSVEDLSMPPKYMCVHHIFDFGEKQIPCSMTLKGPDTIDLHFMLKGNGSAARLEHTAEYPSPGKTGS